MVNLLIIQARLASLNWGDAFWRKGEMMENKQTIYDHRNQKPEEGLIAPTMLKKSEVKKIENHIENTIGKIDMVFHELVSQIIHLDVYKIDPAPDRDFYTLVTVGMSALPMTSPNKNTQYIELMISLPKTWKLSQEDLKDENNYWPIRMLKNLGRFPFEYKTWLGFGHTIPNGNPPAKQSENCNFTGMLLLPSLILRDSWECKADLFKKVHFLALYPLYTSEMDYKVENGVESLFDAFDTCKLSEIVNINREEMKLF